MLVLTFSDRGHRSAIRIHLVTFFKFFIACLCFSFSSRHMLELKFAICHRVAEVGLHRQQASLVDVSPAYGYLTTDSGITLAALAEGSLTRHLFSTKQTLLWMDDKASCPCLEISWSS